MLATKAYLEAKQADDVRRDLSAKLNMSSGSFCSRWQDILLLGRRQARSCQMVVVLVSGLYKGKLLTIEGSMAGIDLGTRKVRTNVSKIRKDFNPIEDVSIGAYSTSTTCTSNATWTSTNCSTHWSTDF